MSVYDCKNCKMSGLVFKSGTDFDKRSSPINKIENPTINSPQDFLFEFDENINGKLMASNGSAKTLIFTLKPINETIHAVTVVPILAPIITLMASVNDNMPALTKLTTITVVADED